MADSRSLTRISEADYEAIESAVMETERGRWFLKEFARRNRSADTDILLQAIDRLERAVVGHRAAVDPTQSIDRFRFDLTEMAKAIARSKMEIAAIRPPQQEHSRLLAASEALDSITRTTEQATSDILEAAEQIQEAAWTLREDGADPDLCDDLDRRATAIYTACSFQDLTAQRTGKIVQTLRYLEDRINSMIGIWGAADMEEAPPEGPTLSALHDQAEDDLSQHDIDNVIVDAELAALPHQDEPPQEFALAVEPFEEDTDAADAPPVAAPLAAEAINTADPIEPEALHDEWMSPTSPDPEPDLPAVMRLSAFADIDALPPVEKLRRFT